MNMRIRSTVPARIKGFAKNLSRGFFFDGDIAVESRETGNVITLDIHCPTDDKSARIVLDDESALQLCRRIMGQIAPMNLVDECIDPEWDFLKADIEAMKKYIAMFEEAADQREKR